MKQTLLLWMMLSAFAYSRAQITVNIPASADNTIYQSPSGSSNALGQNLFSGTNGAGSPRRCLLKFDIASAIPAGALIINASLTLNCNVSRPIADDVTLHKLLSNWGEGTSDAGAGNDGSGVAASSGDATWLANFFGVSNWAASGGDFTPAASATQSINAIGFYSWSSNAMAADVQSWLATPADNFGWLVRCNETTASTARKFASRENTAAANRPVLSVTYTSSLPVLLQYFKATEKDGSVLLLWQTSSEINNSHFKIMHSIDGHSFTQLGIQNSVSATGINRYRFFHHTILPGTHFYKLIQTDLDGREHHSAIEKIVINGTTAAINIWPNPASEKLQVTGTGNLPSLTYSITNVLGTVVQKNKLIEPAVLISGLRAGSYQVSFFMQGRLIGSRPFIKME